MSISIFRRNSQYFLRPFRELSGSSNGDSNINPKVIPKIKSKFNFDGSVKNIKYITPLRSLKEYILSSKDLESLPHYYSRSPYSNEVQTKVFLRSDVEKLAYEKHGGEKQFLIKRKIMKELEQKENSNIFNFNKSVKYLQSGEIDQTDDTQNKFNALTKGAGRVISLAILINGLNAGVKSYVWWITGSDSLFSEAMHSIADTMNQVVLAYGLYSASQKPDDNHPYGYIPMRNITSLISGVGIFFLGSGLTFYHGIMGLVNPHTIESINLGLTVLLGSFLTESITLAMAVNQIKKDSKTAGYDTMRSYLFSGTVDPSVAVLLLEDSAAVFGVMVAGTAMGLSNLTGSHLPDAIGAIAISGILASVAIYIIKSNASILIGKSIPKDKQENILLLLENSKIIRGTYDIKATVISGQDIRFKAEVDIDGRELTKRYLETIPIEVWRSEMNGITTDEQAVHFMLKHGENIVNTLGAEINTVEEKIKRQFPNVKHIDIEIN